MAGTSIYVLWGSPSCLLTLQEAFQDQQVSLTQAPCRLLLLYWVSVCVRFCECPLRLEHEAFCLSQTQALLTFKATHSGGSPSWWRIPGLRSLMWGSDPSLLWEDLCNCDYPSICGLPSVGYYLSHCSSFLYIFGCVKSFLLVFRSFSSLVSL